MSKKLVIDWVDVAEALEPYIPNADETLSLRILDDIWDSVRKNLETTIDHEVKTHTKNWVRKNLKENYYGELI